MNSQKMLICAVVGLLLAVVTSFAQFPGGPWGSGGTSASSGFSTPATLTNVVQIIDTNGTTRFDVNWGFDGDYPGRRPFGYLDELTISASNRNGAAAMGTTFEPSALVWSDASNLLYCVDDEGNLISMAFDGTSKATNLVSAGLDFEAITVAVPTSGYVDIGCERWLSNVATSMIVRMSPTAAFTSANQQRFDVSQIVTSTVTTARMEALTFIPSNAVPSWVPATWTEPLGLYLMSCQNDGYFYLIDVPISTTAYSTNVIVLTRAANMVAAWVPHMLFLTNRNDCADLSFDTRWNRLYAVYDEIGGEVTALSGRGRSVIMFDLALQRAEQEWGLWNNGAAYTSPEGFALGPDRAFCFIGNDGGNASANNNIKRYRFDAYGRETARALDVLMARTPDAEDDAGMGYALGSRWGLTTTGRTYLNVATSDNAAVWADLEYPQPVITNFVTSGLSVALVQSTDVQASAAPLTIAAGKYLVQCSIVCEVMGYTSSDPYSIRGNVFTGAGVVSPVAGTDFTPVGISLDYSQTLTVPPFTYTATIQTNLIAAVNADGAPGSLAISSVSLTATPIQ